MNEFNCPDDCRFGSSFSEGSTVFFDCLKSKELPDDLTFGHDDNLPMCPMYEKREDWKTIIASPEDVVNKLLTQSQVIFVFAEKCQITDKNTQKNAENLLIGAKAAFKKAEGVQKEFLEPINEKEKRIRELFKPYLAKLKLCIDALNKSLGDYHREELLAAKVEQDRILADQAAKVIAAKETGEVIEPLPAAAVISVPAKTSHSEMGSTSYRDDFDIKVVDPNLVPRDLCDPSLTKIKARVKSGITDIPGILVIPKFTPASRAG